MRHSSNSYCKSKCLNPSPDRFYPCISKVLSIIEESLLMCWQVGMGDPHAVVFHLPEGHGEVPSLSSGITEGTSNTGLGPSDNLVEQIMLQMRGYLVDNDVRIIELTSKTLKAFVSLILLILFLRFRVVALIDR